MNAAGRERWVSGRVLAALTWLCVVLTTALGAEVAHAAVQLELEIAARTVEVGEPFRVELSAMGEAGDDPGSPELVVPDGFEVRGPTVGTRQQVSISGLRMQRLSGISATWIVTATRKGVFNIGPASVRTQAGLERTKAIQIKVVEAGSQSARRSRRGRRSFDPFDPFGGHDPFDDMLDRMRRRSPELDRLPEAPPELALTTPPDPVAFVVARIDKPRAVVGEQITLQLYAYGGRGMFQEASGAREPALSDFIAQRLVEDPSRQTVYQFTALGRPWIVVKVREIALFPLREGRLEIGPMTFGFLGRRYPDDDHPGGGTWRQSEPIYVEVSQPPLAGRPPGYTGEVGRFTLVATVEPREVEAGGAIAVSAMVRGQGRLPSALKLPERAGVEWLEPTIDDRPSVRDERVGGTRKFSYLVRVDTPGELDLGDLSLAFFDPAQGTYDVARASLGRVLVKPSARALAAPTSAEPRLTDLGSLRALSEPPEPWRALADRPLFWALLALGPGSVLTLAGAIGATRRLVARWRRRSSSESAQAVAALKAARASLAAGDSAGVASAIERALYRALDAATGLKLRAVLRADLSATLTRAGVGSDEAAAALALLEACDRLRLPGQGADAPAQVAAAERLVKRLGRRRPARGAAAAAPAEAG